ncbi:MAG: RNA-binding S4 domain-containing protein [Steroidobacteraceae bacterium]
MTGEYWVADAGNRHRIDRWLWCARFHRSRTLAAAAVNGGKVHVNGERAKPARSVAVGDRLDITLGTDAWTVIVLALPSRRGPAAEARGCYEETGDSVLRRAVARERRELERRSESAPPGRPDKRGRRAIRQLQGRG